MGLLPNCLTRGGSNDSDDGCTAHHWGEYSVDYSRSRIERSVGGDYIIIHPREGAYCQHDRCNAIDFKPASDVYVPIEATSIDIERAGEVADAVAEMHVEEED